METRGTEPLTPALQSPASPSPTAATRNSGVDRMRNEHTNHAERREFVSRPVSRHQAGAVPTVGTTDPDSRRMTSAGRWVMEERPVGRLLADLKAV